jgi:imidazole glycerol-phosphate synthase subunit HisH
VARIVVVDLGMGNLRSVERALAKAAEDRGAPCEIVRSRRAEDVRAADKVVVPGQGAFRDAATAIAGPIGGAIVEFIRRGGSYLGICLGLQVLFDESEEAPGAAGLGVFPGRVKKLATGDGPDAVKIPHIGWNELEMTSTAPAMFAPFAAAPPHVYFVHSYHAVPKDDSLVVATVTHGPNRITAAVARDNVTAVQFHPEKSQAAGLSLLGAFLAAH